MSPDTDPTTEESPAKSTSEWPGVERRPLLKALGAGATLSLFGAAGATAQGTTTQTDETSELHPVFGLALTADEAVPDSIDPAQVVELDVAEEENIHDGFPLQPDPENPDQFVEAPAEFLFDPVGLHLAPGDIIHFKNLAHMHTVTAFHEKFGDEQHPIPTRVPDGTPGFTSPPFVDDESWLYEFTEPGVYDLFCLPHGGFGMVQRIVVVDIETDTDVPAAPSGEVFPNAQAVFMAPELDPQHIVENKTVAWSDLTLELKASPETTTTTA